MLELMILRHAKSDWDVSSGSDHDRPLSPRGVRAAARMGAFLASADRVPDLALSSSAVRAHTTAESVLSVARDLGHQVPELVTKADLYGASVEQWLGIVAEEIANAKRALIVSHEPTCSSVVQTLTGARCRYPTGAVAMVRIPGPSSLAYGANGVGILESFIIPRLLD